MRNMHFSFPPQNSTFANTQPALVKFFYQAFIILYPLAVRLASPFNRKAKLWLDGRKNIFEKLQAAIDHPQPIVWMHCSSLGEFEQGRPLIEKVKQQYPAYKILITFFSPSGYEVCKNYEHADYVFYLPMDSANNAKHFITIVQPTLIIFVKYEFWHHYLHEAKARNIPTLLISSIFRKSQPFFKSYGNFYRKMLSCFTHIFVQNEESVLQLQSIQFEKDVTIVGDTRFDRVIEIAEKAEPILVLENFLKNKEVIVAGSTWLEDDKELAHFVNTMMDIMFIIAPHNIEKERLQECLKIYKRAALFSTISKGIPASTNAIVIDNIGLLSRLYKYATIAYVGGGFGGDGVHNVLEPAVYGKPVVFGPEYEKYFEAIELVDTKGATTVESVIELEATFVRLLKKDNEYDQCCKAAKEYVYSKRGATDKLLQFIQANRLLTN